MTTDRDCKHGQLARSCNVCELEAEVERQAAEIERLKAEAELFAKYTGLTLAAKDTLLRQALEALENSVDYAEGELTERTRMWSNLPSRAKHLTGLKELADAHVAAITAIKQHLGEQT